MVGNIGIGGSPDRRPWICLTFQDGGGGGSFGDGTAVRPSLGSDTVVRVLNLPHDDARAPIRQLASAVQGGPKVISPRGRADGSGAWLHPSYDAVTREFLFLVQMVAKDV
jgi:hypothetical protein